MQHQSMAWEVKCQHMSLSHCAKLGSETDKVALLAFKNQGEIPVSLTRCSELSFLDLVMNKLEGRIPDELGTLSKLVGLGLAINNLTGPIPPSLSNLSLVEKFSLSENSLSGYIPVELGRLQRLKMFQISSNKFLTGPIPIQLFNISSMEYFAVAENQLIGEIPPYIGFTLPNIRILLLGDLRKESLIAYRFFRISFIGIRSLGDVVEQASPILITETRCSSISPLGIPPWGSLSEIIAFSSL
ncbi:hypothetical protein QYF36_027141 [Acer negundo]|nr:hypothetical protein QYF36_027141 [Acer negundo]